MNMTARTLLVTVLAMAVVASAYAAEEPVRTVSVSGTAVTRTVPDIIAWHVSIEETDKVLVNAKNRSDEKMKSVLELIQDLDVKAEDVQTGRLRINREYDHDERGNRKEFKHFKIYRNVTFKQRDLERFDEFLTEVVGAADIEANFNFESSKQHEFRAETRLKALQVAKEKADSMCKVLGAKLGKVLTIDEHPPTGPDPWGGGRQAQFQSNVMYTTPGEPETDVTSGTLAPGAIPIKVTVYATFEIE
jgi:uncharacterized protein YggE